MLDKVILKSIGGFFYVKVGEDIIECKAKGKFRNLSLSPLVGDKVELDINEKIITDIHPRKNQFIRPPFANLDLLVLVVSTTQPKINYLVVDKICAICESKGVKVCLVITKTDLKEDSLVKQTYEKAGFEVLVIDDENSLDLSRLKQVMKNNLTAFAGNSGVGKTTLMNRIFKDLDLKTNEISKKLNRGKHTTRHVEIFIQDELMIADTPGFSSIELVKENFISAENLAENFIEFNEFSKDCKFNDCRHINEKGCKVIQAVEDEKIALSRYDSYKSLYTTQKQIKDWQVK